MSNWTINYSSLADNSSSKLPSPRGFKPSTPQKHSRSEKTAPVLDRHGQAELKMKRAWDVALAPAKSIPMSLFMMYMSGNSLQIFSVVITATMLFIQPIKAIMSVQESKYFLLMPLFFKLNLFFLLSAFSRFESKESDLTLPKLSFIGLQVIVVLLGIYRVNSMGLLPNTASDWLSFIKPKEILEFAAQ
ncbi:hypothetical protein CU097_009685 [Rhizopus azygosporus]|uniref:ER membrane protein complex subunit 4 n=1 Tax=Rhizopus azygosporus TaxID=86630 RepID=A0A367J773_RHIAZ|nr:hypothetical protein CU097_009685 [Rhizopus azygosporus]